MAGEIHGKKWTIGSKENHPGSKTPDKLIDKVIAYI